MPGPPATRICRSCLHEQPLDQFRRHRRGDESRRDTECRECRNRRERARRNKSPEFQERMRELRHVRDKLDATKVLLLLVNSLGGPEKLRDLFRTEWEAAPLGSKQRQWYLKAILNGHRWIRDWWDR